MLRVRAAVAIAALILYLAIPTKNYYWDGISFAQAIEDARNWTQLLHPNHLLYNVAGFGAYRALGGAVRALYVLQALNSLFAALAVFVLSGVIAGAVKSVGATVLLTAWFAVCGTWWRFSTDADAYVASVALLIWCASLLAPGKPARPIGVALLHAGAMLFHQLALFFLPAALYALWRQHRSIRRARIYLFVTSGVTVAAYAAAFIAQSGSFGIRNFLAWLTSHSSDAAFSFHFGSNAAATLVSWAQLFVSGRPSLVHFRDATTILLLIALAVILLFLIVALRRGIPWRIAIHNPVLFRFALIWLAAYFTFLFFWLSHNTFYKLFALPPAILMVAACSMPDQSPRWGGAAALTVVLLALFNLTFAIIPYSRPAANAAIDFAMRLGADLERRAVVYYWDLNTDDWFARYFNPQTRWERATGTDSIDASLNAGGPVWLETTAIDRFAQTTPEWLAQHTAGAERRELIDARHRIRFVQLRPVEPTP